MTNTLTGATVVAVAGLNTPADVPVGLRPLASVPKGRTDPNLKTWWHTVAGLALRPGGTVANADDVPALRRLYSEEYRITAIPQGEGKVRVLFTPHPEEDDEDAPTERFMFKYKGKMTNKF